LTPARPAYHHIGDPRTRLPVPQVRSTSLHTRDEDTLRSLDDPLRLPADQLVRPLLDGDRTLGVVAQRQTGHAEDRGLLLHATGVGEHQPRRGLQRDEIEVAPGGR
jgi:hypothetical protein